MSSATRSSDLAAAPDGPGRLSGADGVRALACLAVIVFHCVQRLYPYQLSDAAQEVQAFILVWDVGVSVFFVLSGFLLSIPFWRAYLEGGSLPSLREYVRRRAARIVPGYYAALGVSALLALLFVRRLEYFWPRLLTGLTFTSGFHYKTLFPDHGIDSPLWSISFEVCCYALLPLFMALLFRALGRTRSFARGMVFWLAVELLLFGANDLIHRWFTPSSIERGWEFGLVGGSKWWMPHYNPVGFFAQFAVGILAAGVTLRLSRPSRRIDRFRARRGFDAAAALLLIAIPAFLWCVRGARQFSVGLQGQPFYFPYLTVLIGGLLVALAHSRSMGRLLDNRFFRFTARISFGLYVWHFVVANLVNFYVFDHFYQGGMRDWPVWALASALTIGLSYLVAAVSWAWVEKPVLDRAHRARHRPAHWRPEPRGRMGLGGVVNVAALGLLAFLFLSPLVWMLDLSLRPSLEVEAIPPMMFQKPIWQLTQSYTRDSYLASFLNWNVGRALFNSLVVTSGAVLLTGLVCSLCAYALVFMRYRGKQVFFLVAISTMMLPTSTLIVSYYRVMASLHLINSWFGLILPAAASGFSVFLLRQYFIKIPGDLIESAKMEGASHLQIWWHVVLPVARPALAALAVVQFRLVWNDFLLPMVVMRNDEYMTLPLRLASMGEPGQMAATGLISILLPLALFIAFHKKFMETLAVGMKS